MNKTSFFALLLGGLLLMLFGAIAMPGPGVQVFGGANPTGIELGGLMAFVIGFLGLARGSST